MIHRKTALICSVVLLLIFGIVSNTKDEKNISVQSVKNNVPEGELDFETDLSQYGHLKSGNTGWGFKKEKGKAPQIDSYSEELFGKTNTFYVDKNGGKVLYLTFDEGYENGYTGKILDVLKEKNVPAAFFITGHYLENEEELVTRMVNEGHIVGNHTDNHPNLAKSGLDVVRDELKTLNDLFFEKYGKNMVYMRPPEGEYSEKLLFSVSDMGFKTILWSFAYRDWDVNTQKGAEYAFEQVTPYLHDGAIILLHAVSSDNAEALGKIIDYARSGGYEFKSLDNLVLK